jgi:hypothetical protein
VTGLHKDKRSLVDLLSFLFDRLDDDEAAARALLTPAALRHDAASGAARAFRELAAKRSMVAMWFDGVQADLSRPRLPQLRCLLWCGVRRHGVVVCDPAFTRTRVLLIDDHRLLVFE